MAVVTLQIAEPLRPLLYPKRRRTPLELPLDGVSTLGHLLGSVGLPLTEVGQLTADGAVVDPSWLPRPGAVVEVAARRRPQAAAAFVLDVHLGTLARRMRLLGIDTAWRNNASDDELIAQAEAEQRTLLTRDRGLLLRRAARAGAYVRGNRPDEQLTDVLDRFAPTLSPWTRCLACN
ncbi:MAG TPA: Mut7-C RNAse domain-containing protein, partial [Acidimicrobiales bacterium]|nr:Mut7-C RNAse domain-containing protein [Acidimicrobiales bacterium]